MSSQALVAFALILVMAIIAVVLIGCQMPLR
jgi:hypothetical protein